ncbi:MAG: hypothetical protein D6711_16200 [Chloroflexi bacterium]|nr:MAG: hypothetical protein D6711_16200 [Chloroflexota bacterium]
MLITPTHRLMLIYDINPRYQNEYYNYILREFIPMLQRMNVYMLYAWQVIGKGHPERQIEFVCESETIIRSVLASDEYQQAEEKLKHYTLNFRRKLVLFENRCQV